MRSLAWLGDRGVLAAFPAAFVLLAVVAAPLYTAPSAEGADPEKIVEEAVDDLNYITGGAIARWVCYSTDEATLRGLSARARDDDAPTTTSANFRPALLWGRPGAVVSLSINPGEESGLGGEEPWRFALLQVASTDVVLVDDTNSDEIPTCTAANEGGDSSNEG